MKYSISVKESFEQDQIYIKKRGVPSCRLDTELILANCIKKNRAQLYADWESTLSPEEHSLFWALVMRRAKKEPLAYILGCKDFWSFELNVNEHVLIPRPETEILINEFVRLIRERKEKEKKCNILDFGTGCGAIAIALALEAECEIIIGTDISFQALKIAKANIERLGLMNRVAFICDKSLSALKHIKYFDFFVSNPPYIATGDIDSLDPEIRDFEPLRAIDGGIDGLDYYRHLVPLSSCVLKDNGWLLMEIGSQQSAAVMDICQRIGGYSHMRIAKDYSLHDRVIIAQKRNELKRQQRLNDPWIVIH